MFISLGLAVLAFYLLYKWALPKPISNIPYNHPALHSLFGDIPAMIRETKARDQTHMDWIIQQMKNLESPIIQLFLSPLHRPTVILADFRETQDIMLRRKDFDRSTNIRGLLEDVIPDHHIYQQTNSVFRAHRKLVQDVMLPSFIQKVAGPAFHANIMRLVRVWELKSIIAKESPFLITQDIQGAVLDAVYSFAFGDYYVSSTTLPKIEILREWANAAADKSRGPFNRDKPFEFPDVAFDALINATIDLAKAPQGLQGSPIAKLLAKVKMNMPHFRRVRRIRDNFLHGSIQSAVVKLSNRDEKSDCVSVTSALDQMILRETTLARAESRSPNYFSTMMQGELFGLILGGFDTTSTTTLWGLKFLTDNPLVQKRLRKALQSSLTTAKAEGRSPTFQELAVARIPYLEAVVEEILRCAGATPALQRLTTVDTQILGHHIPKGTDVLFLTHGPSVWSPGFDIDENSRSQSCQIAREKKDQRWGSHDIAKFKPERWLLPKVSPTMDDKESDATVIAKEFDGSAGPTLAFGLGTRGCFGRRLGYQQLKTSISILIWNFELLACPPELSSYRTIEGLTSMPEHSYIRLAKAFQLDFKGSRILIVQWYHKGPLDLESQEDDRVRAKALSTSAAALPDGYYRSPRVVASFAAFSLNVIATYFVLQASAAALSNILQDVGPSENQSLFSTLWTTGQAVSILMMGRITDRFGRRPFVLSTHVLGLVGAIVGCTATEFNTLLAAMTMLGVAAGPAGACPLFIGELMSNKAKFLGIMTVTVPNIVATGFAPYLGQRLSIQGSWRWIFYIYIIISVIATSLIFVWYHPPSFKQLHGTKISKREELSKIDWVGIVLVTVGISLFLLGVSWGGQPKNPWDSAKIIGLIASGAATLIVFGLYEVYGRPERPMVPPKLFRDMRGFVCILIISSIMGSMHLSLVIIYPQQVVNIFGSSLKNWEEAAWMSATASFGTWAGVLILGSLFHLIKHIRWQIIMGAIWLTSFLGAMSSITRENKNSAIALSFLTGLVVAWAQDITMLLVQFITTDENLGVAFAVVAAARPFCGSIFTAAFISIYTNRYPRELEARLISTVHDTGFPQASFSSLVDAARSGSREAVNSVPGMTTKVAVMVSQAMADSYTASYAHVYYFAMALGAIPIVAGLYMRDFDCYLTDHVPHQLYERHDANKDILEGDSEMQPSPTIISFTEDKR
ncbi:trichothecene efflux pump [Fusarium longipes]|uniref:Trichothecene efflux pump n=1 Tax=Fusarium longipes TaxID=694270 RepID=A0A395SL23_9HYPO|nr:trichothecene efflux pump [Fusarium longipes]